MKDYEDMTFEELVYEYEKFAGRQATESERVLLAMMHTGGGRFCPAFPESRRGEPAGLRRP